MVCKIWNKRSKDDFIWQFVVKHLTYGEVTLSGRRNHRLAKAAWDTDLENEEIPSWYEYFINRGKTIRSREMGGALEKMMPEKGLGLFKGSSN